MSSATVQRDDVAQSQRAQQLQPEVVHPESFLTMFGQLEVVRVSPGELIDSSPGSHLHVDQQGRTEVSVSAQGGPLLDGALLEREPGPAVRPVPNRAVE